MRTTRGRVLVAALTLVGVPALAAVATATPAQARCNGVGTYVTMVLRDPGGTTVAREVPATGTCNDNGTYHGYLEDPRVDDSCARLTILGITGDEIVDVRACDGERAHFTVYDPDGVVWFRLSAAGLVATGRNFGF